MVKLKLELIIEANAEEGIATAKTTKTTKDFDSLIAYHNFENDTKDYDDYNDYVDFDFLNNFSISMQINQDFNLSSDFRLIDKSAVYENNRYSNDDEWHYIVITADENDYANLNINNLELNIGGSSEVFNEFHGKIEPATIGLLGLGGLNLLLLEGGKKNE